jgi:chloramphenicol 3-O-phosphotransferase
MMRMKIHSRFVVLSGLPGSGKSTLARQLAPALNLAVIDKDEILEHLYDSQGTGDAGWRRSLSRESDARLQAEATASHGALLVSHWRLAGMTSDSGTPTAWLTELSQRIVHVHCVCQPEIAAERFCQRKRHPGHLDSMSSYADVLASLCTLARLGPLKIGPRIDVDTSGGLVLGTVLRDIQVAFEHCAAGDC